MAHNSPPSSGEFKDLTEFLRNWQSFSRIVTGLITALPLGLGLLWPDWVPPWPSGSYAFPVLLSVILILFIFFLYRERSVAPSSTLPSWLLLFALLSFIAYFVLLAN